MYKEVKIGEKVVPMESNGATPIRFRKTFHTDIIAVFSDAKNIDEISLRQLAYIMAKSAEKADMNKLNEDDFIEWISQFENIDVLNALEEVVSVYLGDNDPTSTIKKGAAHKTGK